MRAISLRRNWYRRFPIFALLLCPVVRYSSGEEPLPKAGDPPWRIVAKARGDQPQKRHIDSKTAQRLSEISRRMRPALVLLAYPEKFFGTGFVISRKHRLVATAAHVADCMFEFGAGFAVLDGAADIHRVERVWYHPALTRKLDDGLFVRSFDPKDGPIEYPNPDLAIVQLAPEAGDLPAELELAEDEVPYNTPGTAVGRLGFSDKQDFSLPSPTRPASAEFMASMLRPASTDAERSEERFRGFLYCDAVGFGDGGSGSPIFMADGQVVGVAVNVAEYSRVPGGVDDLRSMNVSGLRDLITYHKLESWMSKPVRQAPRSENWGPDSRLGELRRAVELVKGADRLRASAHYKDAVLKCNDALVIAPDYGAALMQRSKSYLFYLANNWPHLSADQRRQYSSWALADSDRCNELYPHWNGARLIHLENIIWDSHTHGDPSGLHYIVERTTHALGPTWSGVSFTVRGLSFLLNLRAQAHHLLGEMDEAESDYAESIRLDPDEPRWYLNRAQFWDDRKHPDLAVTDRQRAQSLVGREREAGTNAASK
jgi:tetratricopeptide (TPR) repeat protein